MTFAAGNSVSTRKLPMEQRRILVVDDEPDLVHAVRLYLEMEG